MAELDSNPDPSSHNACAHDRSCSVLWGLPPQPLFLPLGPALRPHRKGRGQLGYEGVKGVGQAPRAGGGEPGLTKLSVSPALAWPARLRARHSLGLAVGDHADDAHDKQSHADAGDSQDPLLVQLLGFCRGTECEGAGQEVDLW